MTVLRILPCALLTLIYISWLTYTLASATIPYILNSDVAYTYDTLGRNTGMTLNQNSSAVFSQTYTFDSMSRVATISDGTDTFTFNRLSGLNMLGSVVGTNSSGTILTTTKSYDNARRLLSTSSVFGSTTKSYSYDYNTKDQRTKLTLPDGSYWTYSYDDKGQVTGGVKYDAQNVAIPGQMFGYAFDDIGNRTTMQNSSLNYTYTSNDLNQYTQMTIPGLLQVTGKASESARVTVSRGDGSVASTTRSGKYFSTNLPVDNTSANVSENLTINAVKFDPAQDKDIVASTSRTGTALKTPRPFTYDDDGNMTSDAVWTYTWNGENRLTEAVKTNDKKLEFAYDYTGRRIYKKVYNWVSGAWSLTTHRNYVYNDDKLLVEYDGVTGSLLQKYIWQPGNVGQDVPLSVADTGAGMTYYYIVDGNKNVRALIDSSGNVLAEYDYTPFGRINGQSGTYASTNPFRFSSEYHDDETGLVYYNYRYYSPELGRWTKRDPIGEIDGKNVYGMIGNNAIYYYDIYGLGCEIIPEEDYFHEIKIYKRKYDENGKPLVDTSLLQKTNFRGGTSTEFSKDIKNVPPVFVKYINDKGGNCCCVKDDTGSYATKIHWWKVKPGIPAKYDSGYFASGVISGTLLTYTNWHEYQEVYLLKYRYDNTIDIAEKRAKKYSCKNNIKHNMDCEGLKAWVRWEKAIASFYAKEVWNPPTLFDKSYGHFTSNVSDQTLNKLMKNFNLFSWQDKYDPKMWEMNEWGGKLILKPEGVGI